MRYVLSSLIVLSSLVVLSCSQSESGPAPEPNVTSKLVGTYTLTKMTNKDTGEAVNGTGSVTLTAVDNTMASLSVATQVITSKGSYNDKITFQSKVVQVGSDYQLKDGSSTDSPTIGSVSGNTITLTTKHLASDQNLIREFTK
ncbi:hypothetical protein [Spirosoma validum]|uniref:Lipocalin-like domain-containing protein n=1 Tax=Spirosoma validum TaxID=2771355 RepID=A0A927B4P6_9BACT|nr:hypothetical protein [Spirosoma validum]MBD2755599.1 hypothetical protein [Spirosoma validum]